MIQPNFQGYQDDYNELNKKLDELQKQNPKGINKSDFIKDQTIIKTAIPNILKTNIDGTQLTHLNEFLKARIAFINQIPFQDTALLNTENSALEGLQSRVSEQFNIISAKKTGSLDDDENINTISDMTFVCSDGVEVEVRLPVILIEKSPFFKALLEGNFEEKETKKVHLGEVDSETFKLLLDGIADPIVFDQLNLEKLVKLLDAADKLHLELPELEKKFERKDWFELIAKTKLEKYWANDVIDENTVIEITQFLSSLHSFASTRNLDRLLKQTIGSINEILRSALDEKNNDQLATIVEHLSHTEGFKLELFTYTSDQLEIIKKLPLKDLFLDGNNLNNKDLENLPKSLEKIDFHLSPWLTLEGINHLNKLPNLARIDIWAGNSENDIEKVIDFLLEFTEKNNSDEQLHSCQRFIKWEINDAIKEKKEDKLNKIIEVLAKHQEIDLEFDSHITNYQLEKFKKLPLKGLSLSNCDNLKNKDLANLPQTLEKLDLSYNQWLTKEGLAEIKLLPKLSKLVLTNCTRLQEADIQDLPKHIEVIR